MSSPSIKLKNKKALTPWWKEQLLKGFRAPAPPSLVAGRLYTLTVHKRTGNPVGLPTVFFYLDLDKYSGNYETVLPADPDNSGSCNILVLEQLESLRYNFDDFFYRYKVVLESGLVVAMRIRPEDEVSLRLVKSDET